MLFYSGQSPQCWFEIFTDTSLQFTTGRICVRQLRSLPHDWSKQTCRGSRLHAHLTQTWAIFVRPFSMIQSKPTSKVIWGDFWECWHYYYNCYILQYLILSVEGSIGVDFIHLFQLEKINYSSQGQDCLQYWGGLWSMCSYCIQYTCQCAIIGYCSLTLCAKRYSQMSNMYTYVHTSLKQWSTHDYNKSKKEIQLFKD